MRRYRCTHCETVFTAGEVRDCCLPAAVSEQHRLRRKLTEAELSGKVSKLLGDVERAVSR